MRCTLISLCAVVGLLLAAAPARADKVSYALIIGNNAPPSDQSDTLGTLRYADDDAVRYYQLFSRAGTARLLAVLDTTSQRRYPGLASQARPPTLSNFRAVLAEFARAMAADRARGDQPVLYFAFSGHGSIGADGGAFLALLDGELTRAVLFDEILTPLPAVYIHLLIDACHAGGVVGVRGDFFGSEAEALTTPVRTEQSLPLLEEHGIAQFPHVGVVLATTLGQEAHEWSQIEAGVFSHELLSGLVGPADVNGDGAVEYTEIQAFVAAANRGIEDPRAAPMVVARPPSANHNVPLLSLEMQAGTRVVSGEVGGLGHFYVELANGQRYLDAHLEPGAVVTMAVPAETVAYLRTGTLEVQLPQRTEVAIAELTMTPRAVAGRGSVADTYRRALFSSAYGRSYYQGFVDSTGAVGVRFSLAPVADVRHTDDAGASPAAIGAATVSGGATAVSLVSLGLAVRAKRQFDRTDLQAPAHDAKVRYERYRAVAIGAGATAVAAGLVAWWLWPESPVKLAPSTSDEGGYGMSLEVAW